ncbi:MAG: NAD(P)-dependent oxidoreductase [Chloroflexota bacterium]
MSEKTQAGFIGLGLMGKPMARNLMRAGFALAVHNRSRGKVDELAAEGAAPAGSPAEVAARCEFVCTCLPGPADVRQVYLGPDGVLAGARAGSVLIEMSTIDPETHRELAAAAAARGAAYLDAPVSGGTTGAEKGTLTIMVGGEAEALERARPLLAAMGERIFHLGPVGAGAVAKLINNMLGAINLLGVYEGLVLGVKAGLDPRQLAEVVSSGSGASRQFAAGAPNILKRDFAPGFTLDLMAKDVALARQLGESLGVRLEAGTLASQVLEETRQSGLGQESIYAGIKVLEGLAGVEVKGKKAPRQLPALGRTSGPPAGRGDGRTSGPPLRNPPLASHCQLASRSRRLLRR